MHNIVLLREIPCAAILCMRRKYDTREVYFLYYTVAR